MTAEQVEKNLGHIVEDSCDGYWVIDAEGQTLYVNARAAELLGRTREEMASLNVLDVLDKPGRAQFRAHLIDLREHGPSPVDVECGYRTPDGELVHLMLGEWALHDDDGEFLGYVHRLVADSSRLKVLDELRRSRTLLADAQAIARLGSWEYDTVGDTSAWSAQLYEILGLDPETTEPSVTLFFDMVLDEDRAGLWGQFLAVQEDRVERSYDARIVRTDGQVRWVRATGRTLTWSSDGRALRIGGAVQDIDDAKQIELQLRDSVVINSLMQFMAAAANEARTLLEAISTLHDLLLAHPDWQSAVAFEVTDGGRLVALDLPGVPPPTERERHAAEQGLRAGTVSFDEESDPQHPSIMLPVMLHGQPLVIAVITAMTPFERQPMLRSMAEQIVSQLATVALRETANKELADARDAAMEASRSKSEFVATMSHEIRTPLNGVIGLNDLLLRTDLDERQRQLAEGMRGAGHALLGLISDILDFSKIEAGALELEQVAFSPAGVAREVVELFRPAADARGNTLTAEIDADVPAAVVGDPGRFRQVLSNLVSNAVKFTSGGAVRVCIEATLLSGAVALRVEVRDTGIGMDHAQLQRSFEPFRQADASTTRDYGGTGLGLTIARQLAVALGGELGASSVPGRGSTFWFTGTFLLGNGESVGGAGTDPADATAWTQHSGHVLVVEDNEINQLVVLGMLEAMGFTAEIASDGLQGAQKALAGRFDVVLMDLQMPGTDGFEGVRRIRAGESPGEHLPVIALTASTTEDVRERCAAAGMDGFLTKPLAFDRLGGELIRWMGDGRATAPDLSPSPVALDTSRLDELADMGPAAGPLIRRAVDNFVSGASDRLLEVRRHLAAGDAAQLGDAAHALKGSAANLGAVEVADLARGIEELARSETADTATLADLVRRLEGALGNAVVALQAHRLMAQVPAPSPSAPASEEEAGPRR